MKEILDIEKKNNQAEIECDLDKLIWAVVGAKRVWDNRLTYNQCISHITDIILNKSKLAYELVITTSEAADRFLENQRHYGTKEN